MRIVLFDAALGTYRKLQQLFEKSLWLYRDERTRKGVNRLRKQLAAAGVKFTSSFHVFFVALEVLELCEAYLTLCNGRSRTHQYICSKISTTRFKEIRRHYRDLLFTVRHFRCVVELHDKTRINKWLTKIEQCVRKVVCIGRSESLQCS
ncbi:unnamed protein product [Gongylonema pulchrum]|uniref:Uncharacterized protein n=1 Tax=Gongylonema pulchrum TaxID=637853 RepID=A0A3P6PYF3_9BILA|nr:unnamed protein product [Gongylonema pulchrum]